MPGNLPLYDADVRNEEVYFLPQGWDPVLEKDVDGSRSEPHLIENAEARFGQVQACRKLTRTIFLGSSASCGLPACCKNLKRYRV
jgi:predicted AAA+ superfamily ATPase